ncbi:MAG: DNRLRE domain-containing protein [Bacteroidetes bacterium]|nr:DNRLRE domain-containing protein [Bacteroidota bacterium]
MKKTTSSFWLVFALLIVTTYTVAAQQPLVTATPAQNDFCNGTAYVTLTINSPDPNYTYDWYDEDYTAFNQNGGMIHNLLASGVTSLTYSSSYCNRVNITATDNNTGFTYGFDYYMIGTNLTLLPGNKIPYWEYNFGCRKFLIPIVFYALLYNVPNRTGNWYKDGAIHPTSYHELVNPDKGKYYYKLTLACGTELTTDTINITTTLPPAPVISALGNTTICNGDSVNLTVNGAWPNYFWERNGSIIANANQNNYNAKLAGTYKMGYYNSNGCSVTSSNSIVVSVLTGPKITAYDTLGCPGDSLLLSCNSAVSYQWKKNNINIANATQQNIYVKTAGSYTVVTGGLQCSVSQPVSISYFANPTISISPSGTLNLCSGNGLDFTATATNGASYKWYKTNYVYPISETNTLFVPESGSYYCIATSAQGCTKKSNTTVLVAKSSASLPSVTQVLQPNASGIDAYIEKSQPNTNYGNTPSLLAINYVTGNPLYRTLIKFNLNSIPAGVPIISAKLSLYSDSLSTYGTIHKSFVIRQITQPWNEQTVTWNTQPAFKDLGRIEIADGTTSYQDVKNIDVRNSVKQWSLHPADNNGWMLARYNEAGNPVGAVHFASGDYGTPSRRPKLVVKYANAKIDTSASTTFCNGDSVKFTTNAGSYTYQWYKGSTPINGATSSSYTATTAGKYSVKITNTDGCSVESATKAVVVQPNPAITLTPLGSTTFCNGDSVKLQTNGVGTYQWRKNNNVIANATLQTYTVKTAGKYTVRVTKPNGCSRTSTEVQVKVPCKLPSLLHNEAHITIYPNPTKYMLNIESSVDCSKIAIFDLSGRQIFEGKFSNQLNLEFLNQGVYYLHLLDMDGISLHREKIIKID